MDDLVALGFSSEQPLGLFSLRLVPPGNLSHVASDSPAMMSLPEHRENTRQMLLQGQPARGMSVE
jgi:hypothetical protein